MEKGASGRVRTVDSSLSRLVIFEVIKYLSTDIILKYLPRDY